MLDQFLGDIPTPVKFILAFAIVIALVFVVIWLMRKLGGQRLAPTASAGRSRQPRLGVLDVLMIDSGRRLVILRRDNVEHLVMIGGPNDLVIESGILRVPAAMGQRDAPALGASLEPPARATPPQPIPPAQTRLSPSERPAAAPTPPELQRAPQLRMPEQAASRQTAQPAPAAARPAPQRPGAPVASPARPASAPPAASAPAHKPAREREEPRGLELTAEDLDADFGRNDDVRPAEARASGPRREEPRTPPARRSAAAPAGQPIIAGPVARQSELAERLSAALQRPVVPVERGPQTGARDAAALELEGPETGRPASSGRRAGSPDLEAPNVVTHAADDLPRRLPAMSDETSGSAGAPEVKPDKRAAAAADEHGDDPLASLEAEMANLLGRDAGRSNS